MICGYEYGYNEHDKYLEKECSDFIKSKTSEFHTFHTKTSIYDSPYDKKIIKWFDFFGHPLGLDGGNSKFDKCILQTNWCDGQGTYVNDYEKFLAEENVNNFLSHVENYRPSLLIFMGSKLIDYLQNSCVKNRFTDIFGNETSSLEKISKDFSGRKFRIGFQSFENTTIISFPHPSGTRGLHNDYIKLFKPEIHSIIQNFRVNKGV